MPVPLNANERHLSTPTWRALPATLPLMPPTRVVPSANVMVDMRERERERQRERERERERLMWIFTTNNRAICVSSSE